MRQSESERVFYRAKASQARFNAPVPIALDQLPDDPQALRRIIAAMAQDALTAQAEIARLKFRRARYQRAEFGRSSEKLAREAEQLELAIAGLEEDQAERLATVAPAVAAAIEDAAEAQNRPAGRCRTTCRARTRCIPLRAPAPLAAGRCAGSGKILPRPSITCPAASR